MHYIAWLIGQGAVPYRDVFDMNLPGVYLIHVAVLGLLRARRPRLAALRSGLARRDRRAPVGILRGRSAPGRRGGAALLFALYHLSGRRLARRTARLPALPLPARGRVRRCPLVERGGALGPLLWGGLALGAGHDAEAPRRRLLAGARWRSPGGGAAPRRPLAARRAGTVLAAASSRPRSSSAGSAWRGGLGPFVAVFTGYVVPLYSQVGRVPLWQAIRLASLRLGALGLLACWRWPCSGSAPAPGAGPASAWLALAAWAFGRAPLRAPGQGLGVPALPARRSSSARCARRPRSAGVAAGERTAPRRCRCGRWPPARRRARRSSPPPPWCSAPRGWTRWSPVDRRQGAPRRRAHRATCAAIVPPGAHRAGDGHDRGRHPRAAAACACAQPTRFIYDFHFFHDAGDPRIDRAPARSSRRASAGTARRHRGLARHLAPPRLRAARATCPAVARLLDALVHPRRRGRRLPDLCEASDSVASSAPTTTRRARLLLGALLDPAAALSRRDRPVPARAGPRARPGLRLRALLALLRGAWPGLDASRGSIGTRGASTMARAAAGAPRPRQCPLRGRRRDGLPRRHALRRRLHARHRPPRPRGRRCGPSSSSWPRRCPRAAACDQGRGQRTRPGSAGSPSPSTR